MGDIIGLVFIHWTSQLNITIVETLILSVIAIIWTLYEFRSSKLSSNQLVGMETSKSFLELPS